MVMTHALLQCRYELGIAHIDHGTRAGQSAADAEFVAHYASKHDVPYYQLNLTDEDKSTGNFQAVARKLRYAYCQEVKQLHNYDYICTAHHKDDKWETLFFNLMRASGLDGLSSLRAVEGDVIRPLLQYSRRELEAFALSEGLVWVDDSSNAENHYQRNKIRNIITPVVREVFPLGVEQAVASSILLDHDRLLLQHLVKIQFPLHTDATGRYWDLDVITSNELSETILYQLLKPYGANIADCRDISKCSTTGSVFDVAKHQLLYDRGRLFIRHSAEVKDLAPLAVELGEQYTWAGYHVSVTTAAGGKYNIIDGKSPLTIRRWQPGDRFTPKGMHGQSKKVKDFLTDSKLHRWQKDAVGVLTCGDKLLSVVGYRDATQLAELGLVVQVVPVTSAASV